MMDILIGFGMAMLLCVFLVMSLFFAMYVNGDLTFYKGK